MNYFTNNEVHAENINGNYIIVLRLRTQCSQLGLAYVKTRLRMNELMQWKFSNKFV